LEKQPLKQRLLVLVAISVMRGLRDLIKRLMYWASDGFERLAPLWAASFKTASTRAAQWKNGDLSWK
jgi:hypothetical protein